MKGRLHILVALALVACSMVYAQPKYKLAITTLFQNEARFLREWIEYHKLVGVEHFYLYNNLSDDNYLEVLQPYIDCEEVTLVDWPYGSSSKYEPGKRRLLDYAIAQKKAYGHAIMHAECEWLAVIDADEFLVPANDDSLIPLLDAYRSKRRIGGIGIPWVMFGTSGVERIPHDRLMIELLLLHWPHPDGFYKAWAQHKILGSESKFVHKSIVRVSCVRGMINSHEAIYHENKRRYLVPVEEAQINHYWTRDEAFLREVKIPRRENWGFDGDYCLKRAACMVHQSILGERILRFVPQLRAAMEKESLCDDY